MNKPTVDFAEDSAENQQPSSGELVQVSALASRLIQIDAAKTSLYEQISKLDEEYDRIQSADLPGLMDQIGLKTFTLSTGETVVVKPIIKGGLPTESTIQKETDPERRAELRERFEQGLIFLSKAGAGALIKNLVSAELGKDSNELASAAVEALRDLGIDPSVTRGVNPMSLNAWIKERIASGADIDHDIFKIYSGSKAEVKQPKSKKGF